MKRKEFKSRDYYSASLERKEDLDYLLKNEESIIFAIYCAGVSIECMLRAYITNYTKEFDSKHNLNNLYNKSLISQKLNESEKKKMLLSITTANKLWDNNLRYTSKVRMKRMIVHNMARAKFKNIDKFLKSQYTDFFKSTDYIIEKGEEKWN